MTNFKQEHLNKDLILAILNGDPDRARSLIAMGASPDCHTGGDAVLHVAASCLDYACIEVLLETGINVNARNCVGETALHIVVAHPDVLDSELIIFLLEQGADPHIRDDGGLNVFDIADEETLKVLKSVRPLPLRPGIPDRLRALLRNRPPVPGL